MKTRRATRYEEEANGPDATTEGSSTEEDVFLPRRGRQRFPWIVLLVCYIAALIVVHKYGTSTSSRRSDNDKLKDTECEADRQPKRKKPLREALKKILKSVNLVGSEEKSSTKQQKDIRSKKKTKQYKVYFENAHSTEPSVSSQELDRLQEFSKRVLTNVTNLQHRASHVGFGDGGSTSHHHAWWPHHHRGGSSRLDKIEGGRLLYSYYKIMTRHMKDPKDLSANILFPFKLCKGGCSAEQAIAHTLEWREAYQPWRVTPSLLKENENGWVYTRGFSPPARGSKMGRHAMLYIRPGKHKVRSGLSYFRAILNSADRLLRHLYRIPMAVSANSMY